MDSWLLAFGDLGMSRLHIEVVMANRYTLTL